MIQIKFNAKKILILMFSIVILILLSNVIFFWLESKGVGSFHFNSLFYVNEESNIPTYFSGLNLLFASIITFIVGLRSDISIKTTPVFWRLLSLLFLFLSFDEVAMFHERIYRVTVLFTDYFNTPLVWYVPYSLFAVVIITILWKNFMRLDFYTKVYMGASGVIFLTGAIGLEHISNNCDSIFETKCTQFGLFGLSSLEETFEMISICLFNYATLKLFTGNYDHISIQIKRQNN